MISVNDDVTTDGWLALCIAILCGCPQQEAFRRLEQPFTRRRWTEDDFLEIEYLRSKGASWREVGEIMRVNKSNVLRQWQFWQAKQKKCR